MVAGLLDCAWGSPVRLLVSLAVTHEALNHEGVVFEDESADTCTFSLIVVAPNLHVLEDGFGDLFEGISVEETGHLHVF